MGPDNFYAPAGLKMKSMPGDRFFCSFFPLFLASADLLLDLPCLGLGFRGTIRGVCVHCQIGRIVSRCFFWISGYLFEEVSWPWREGTRSLGFSVDL